MLRMGHGFDVHAFGPGDHVMLGGVWIAHHQGLLAHSDGDVILHALCDALLGALALGDIGQHFSDKDPRWRDMASRHFLAHVRELLARRAYQPVNVDVTVIAQAPRLALHVAAMRQNIAAELDMPVADVSIKATTTEGLGFTGRAEGIAAHAVALIQTTIASSPL